MLAQPDFNVSRPITRDGSTMEAAFYKLQDSCIKLVIEGR